MTAEECSNEELMHKLREAHFASDDFKMQELDATTKKFTDRIQDKIVKYVCVCFGSEGLTRFLTLM